MADTTQAIARIWDAALGANLLQVTVANLLGAPAIPAEAFDIQAGTTDGQYTLSYKIIDSLVAGANLDVQWHCSTEPLITHPIFQTGGAYALSLTDKTKIGEAQSDWKAMGAYAAAGTTPIGAYFFLILAGVDSYLNPQGTMRCTKLEATLPPHTGVGKVVSSPPPGAPALEGDANWLLVAADGKSASATKFRNVYEYRASALKGWSATLYGGSAVGGLGW